MASPLLTRAIDKIIALERLLFIIMHKRKTYANWKHFFRPRREIISAYRQFFLY
jgi:hypothetical protein